jgi:hypothetical protein
VDSKGEITGFTTQNSFYKAIFPLARPVIERVKEDVPQEEELETIIEELEAGWLK